ncbi:MAG: ABC transporter permease [Candidatus Kerfeldbacteria bacterium]|nr:ABC transporter permease [Candidatus Kerfeldbacteria bacterium]
MAKQHENYRELIWRLAKTDFTLRYHGSVLGYVWAILKPLFIFTILNFVFSSIFNPRGQGNEYYSLELIVAIMVFNFFAEGTTAGMNALLSKSELVKKIYVPRWTIIVAATVNSALVFLMNLGVVIIFFGVKEFVPSIAGVAVFLLYICLLYIIIVTFGLFTAPLYVYFRDLMLIWEVLLTALFYATPVFYSLTMMPDYIQRVLLLSPIAFIIHFTKESLIHHHFADVWQNLGFMALVAVAFGLSTVFYRKVSPSIAEKL